VEEGEITLCYIVPLIIISTPSEAESDDEDEFEVGEFEQLRRRGLLKCTR
jgi:hypothetical protein